MYFVWCERLALILLIFIFLKRWSDSSWSKFMDKLGRWIILWKEGYSSCGKVCLLICICQVTCLTQLLYKFLWRVLIIIQLTVLYLLSNGFCSLSMYSPVSCYGIMFIILTACILFQNNHPKWGTWPNSIHFLW